MDLYDIALTQPSQTFTSTVRSGSAPGTALVIYVSGPYSAPTEGGRLDNVNRAIQAGREILDLGHYPLIPHLTHFFDEAFRGYNPPVTYEQYMQWDLALLERCDALLRLEGPSPGADRECARAEELGLPIYTSLEEIPNART